MTNIRYGYPLFSLQTNHVLGVHRWSEVKPAENDEVIYEQPLIDDALNAGLNFKMVEKELHSARVGENHFFCTNEIHRFVLCQVKPSVIRDHIKMISRVWSSLLCALVNTKQASFTAQGVSIS